MSDQKRALRRLLLAQRDALDAESRIQCDALIAKQVETFESWRKAHTIYTYLSVGAEVDTRDLVRLAWGQNKRVAVPCCVPKTRDLRWFELESFDGLVRTTFGIEEPIPDERLELDKRADEHTVALVPALAFDRRGYRLGYGGGFYDAFLATFEGTSIGLCRTGSFLDSLAGHNALEPHDKTVDFVIGPQGAYPLCRK